MIDIHSHILPGIDDGSQNIKNTMDMINKAEAYGVKKIIVTPHYIQNTLENTKEYLMPKFNFLKELIDSLDVNIDLSIGTEVMIFPDIVKYLKQNKICTLNNSRYLLIEFPMNIKVPNVCNVLEDIIKAGYIPVIAHPERYIYVINNFKEAKKYVDSGALLQINISSLVGEYGNEVKKAAIKLLKNDLIHLWGSDSHEFRLSYTDLDKSFKELKRYTNKKQFDNIVNINPEKVYNNEEIKI